MRKGGTRRTFKQSRSDVACSFQSAAIFSCSSVFDLPGCSPPPLVPNIQLAAIGRHQGPTYLPWWEVVRVPWHNLSVSGGGRLDA